MNSDELWAEIELLQTCEDSICSLLIPDESLGVKARDHLGILLGYLNHQREQALEQLHQQIKEQQ